MLRFFSRAARSQDDRGQPRSPGPDPVCLDPFRRPLRPCRGGHAISRSRGSITKVGTHFHVAATRRTGYLFFFFCPSLSAAYPRFTAFSLREPIFILRKSPALAITQQFSPRRFSSLRNRWNLPSRWNSTLKTFQSISSQEKQPRSREDYFSSQYLGKIQHCGCCDK